MSNLKRELGRALENKRYETDPESGLTFFPAAKLGLQGVFDIAVNDGPIEYFPNLVIDQWRTRALEILFASATQITAYYLAPFAGNVAPAASLTAATFTATQTEFTNYTEAARQAWTVGAVDTFAIGNAASKAVFTIGAGAQTVIWGAGLLSTSAKSSTAGYLVAASKAASARDDLVENDEITLGYTITLNDAS